MASEALLRTLGRYCISGGFTGFTQVYRCEDPEGVKEFEGVKLAWEPEYA